MGAWAKPGVRCACIDDDLRDIDSGQCGHYVIKGAIYKITSVWFHDGFEWAVLGLWGMPLGQGFDVRAFRPLVDLTDDATKDVALFLDIAGHAPVLNGEDA